MKEILRLEHIQKIYGTGGSITKAIRDISFTVEEGEFVGIMGASGSGKTRVYLRSQKCWDIRQKAPDARRMSAALLHGMQRSRWGFLVE